MLRLGIAWALPAIWIGLSPPTYFLSRGVGSDVFNLNKRLSDRTRSQLNNAQKIVADYFATNKTNPFDLSDLRLYGASKNKTFPTYDTFGQRLDYVRLDESNYFLRSFGQDGVQNSMMTAGDIGVGRLSLRPTIGITFKYATAAQFDVFPAVFLLGAESPSRLWHASLYVDRAPKDQPTRRLLVRHATQKNLIMIAEHDRIEEFLWLPNGYQIVYTATGSHRYRDGLYLWNLLDDTTIDLTELFPSETGISSGTPNGRLNKLFLSLAGINVNGPTIYAYYAPRQEGAALDPEAFFAKQRLLAFQIPEKDAPKLLNMAHELPNDEPPFARPLHMTDHVDTITGGLKAQQAWLKLELHGDMENILMSWQSFSENESNTPLLPYCLWYLSSLYSESFTLIQAQGQDLEKEAEVLRTYGTELARALADFDLAPSYLRGLALYTYDGLMKGESLPYRFAHLSTRMAQEASENPAPKPVAQPSRTPKKPLQWQAPATDTKASKAGIPNADSRSPATKESPKP